MCSTSALAIRLTCCGVRNTHTFFSAGRLIGDMLISGVWLSTATSAMASDAGVTDEPNSTSTFSSVTSLRAFLVAADGSVPSSRTM